MSKSITVYLFNLDFKIYTCEIEDKINEMSKRDFKKYALNFFEGKQHGFDYSLFKSHEEWQEAEKKCYPVIREEDNIKLCWNSEFRLICFKKYVGIGF